MGNQFEKLDYVQFYRGSGKVFCQVDAQHAKPPQADLYTGQLVRKIVGKTGCAAVISTVSRTIADLNRKEDEQNKQAIEQYRKVIFEILQHLGVFDQKNHRITKPYLHITIHGMKDDHYGPYAIEIGTYKGLSCSRQMKKWFRKTIALKAKEILPELKVWSDQHFYGNESITYHRHGDGEGYNGYGYHFHTIQMELSRTLREKHSLEMAELLSQVMVAFQTEIVEGKRK
jgi:hypothetical protein